MLCEVVVVNVVVGVFDVVVVVMLIVVVLVVVVVVVVIGADVVEVVKVDVGNVAVVVDVGNVIVVVDVGNVIVVDVTVVVVVVVIVVDCDSKILSRITVAKHAPMKKMQQPSVAFGFSFATFFNHAINCVMGASDLRGGWGGGKDGGGGTSLL